MEGAPPIRRARADNQMEVDISHEDEAFRNNRLLPYVRQSSNGPDPYVATQVDVADEFADPIR